MRHQPGHAAVQARRFKEKPKWQRLTDFLLCLNNPPPKKNLAKRWFPYLIYDFDLFDDLSLFVALHSRVVWCCLLFGFTLQAPCFGSFHIVGEAFVCWATPFHPAAKRLGGSPRLMNLSEIIWWDQKRSHPHGTTAFPHGFCFPTRNVLGILFSINWSGEVASLVTIWISISFQV